MTGVICAACRGTGCRDPLQPGFPCPACQGTGQSGVAYAEPPIFSEHARTLPPPPIYAPEPFSRAEIKALVAKMEAAQREALVAFDERIRALEARRRIK